MPDADDELAGGLDTRHPGKADACAQTSRSFNSERLRPNASPRIRTQSSRSGGSGSVVSRRFSTPPGAEPDGAHGGPATTSWALPSFAASREYLSNLDSNSSCLYRRWPT